MSNDFENEVGGMAYDDVHEVLQHRLEVAVARDGDGDEGERAEGGPDEARNGLRPAGHDLQRQAQAVDVRAVVGDDAQSQNDEAELAKAAQRGNEHGAQDAADAGCVVADRVDVAGAIGVRGCDCEAEHLDEGEGEDESEERPQEAFCSRSVDWLINSVVCGVGTPAGGIAEDDGRKG